jgi:hypothetical protein
VRERFNGCCFGMGLSGSHCSAWWQQKVKVKVKAKAKGKSESESEVKEGVDITFTPLSLSALTLFRSGNAAYWFTNGACSYLHGVLEEFHMLAVRGSSVRMCACMLPAACSYELALKFAHLGLAVAVANLSTASARPSCCSRARLRAMLQARPRSMLSRQANTTVASWCYRLLQRGQCSSETPVLHGDHNTAQQITNAHISSRCAS